MTGEVSYESLMGNDASVVRHAIRHGAYRGHTAGLAPGKLQVNLAILPKAFAPDFEQFCRMNPQPCPLVGMTDPGVSDWSSLGAIDVRTDVPSYNIYCDGVFQTAQGDISDLWSHDLVAFALGCSFTFETALLEAGIPLAHIEANRSVPMYRTDIDTVPVGPFKGGMVVSLRYVSPDLVDQASEVTAQFPWAHGAPIHIGDPSEIGIRDVAHPDWGDPPVSTEGVPMFWACGVTPQNALAEARPPLCITHTPGRMLITDIDDRADSFLK